MVQLSLFDINKQKIESLKDPVFILHINHRNKVLGPMIFLNFGS